MPFYDLSLALNEAKEITDKTITKLLASTRSNHAILIDAMRYSVTLPGKRIRPYLVLEFCRLFSGSEDKGVMYGASVEMLHVMSLVHDDLPAMDNDDLRRNKPSNHIVFGEATAILAGDALLTEAFRVAAENPLCSPEQNLQAVIALAAYGGKDGMMGGQQIDLQSEHASISAEVLEDLVAKKTAALISCSCVLGCIAGGGSPSDMESSAEFGRHLGLAFQIIDDLLDIRGDKDKMGKTPGADAQKGKNTYPALLGQTRSEELAKEHTNKAKSVIKSYPNSGPARRLLQLCDYLLDRES